MSPSPSGFEVDDHDLPDGSYSLQPSAQKQFMRQVAPSVAIRHAQKFAIVLTLVVAILLLVFNLTVPREQISYSLLDGWKCVQLSSKSRSLAEIRVSGKCGYRSQNVKGSMNWINYEAFQGKSEQSEEYTQLPECFTSKVPVSERNKPIWTVRDTYTWNDQAYTTWETCKASLASMCKAHLVDAILVDSGVGAAPYTPYFALPTLYSNARDKSSTAILNSNSRWLVFNSSKQSCPTVCSSISRSPKSFNYATANWNYITSTSSSNPPTIASFSSFAVTADMKVAYAAASLSGSTSKLLRSISLKDGVAFSEVSFSATTDAIHKIRISGDGLVMVVQTKPPSNSASQPLWWLSTDGSQTISPLSFGASSSFVDAAISTNAQVIFVIISSSGSTCSFGIGTRSGSTYNFQSASYTFVNFNPSSSSSTNPSISDFIPIINTDGSVLVLIAPSINGKSPQLAFSVNAGANWNELTIPTEFALEPLTTSFAMSGDGRYLFMYASKSESSCVVQRWSTATPQFTVVLIGYLVNLAAWNNDGSALAVLAVTATFTSQLLVSTDLGTSWKLLQPKLPSSNAMFLQLSGGYLAFSVSVATSTFGKTEGIYISGAQSLQTELGLLRSNVTSIVLPTMSYDETLSLSSSQPISGSNSVLKQRYTCASRSTVIGSSRSYDFCDLYDGTSSSTLGVQLLESPWEDKLEFGEGQTKFAAGGKWTFGSFGFCLDSSKYATCQNHFQSEMCSSGYFQEMFADVVCNKYKENPPYSCSNGPDVFSALSLAASTASTVMSVMMSVLLLGLQKLYAHNQQQQDTARSSSASSSTEQYQHQVDDPSTVKPNVDASAASNEQVGIELQ